MRAYCTCQLFVCILTSYRQEVNSDWVVECIIGLNVLQTNIQAAGRYLLEIRNNRMISDHTEVRSKVIQERFQLFSYMHPFINGIVVWISVSLWVPCCGDYNRCFVKLFSKSKFLLRKEKHSALRHI